MSLLAAVAGGKMATVMPLSSYKPPWVEPEPSRQRESRQFSLAYLLLEVLWVAIVLGSIRQTIAIGMNMGAMAGREYDGPKAVLCFLLMMAATTCAGAAVGGILGSMRRGAIVGLGLGLLILLLPCGLYAIFSPWGTFER